MSWLTTLTAKRERIEDHYLFHKLTKGMRIYLSDTLTKVFLVGFLVVLFFFVFGQAVAPHGYDTIQENEQGEIKSVEPPSTEHWLGTTSQGYDVFSRLSYGARPTLLVGLLSGLLVVSFGLLVGVTAGYYGGTVDSVLMRFTDFAYGIPFIPTAIVLIAFFGMGYWSVVILIGLLLWRGNARVFRSQVLQLKEREYVQAAEMLGGSDRYIILRHILPKMGGMIMLFFALGCGTAILIAAGLAFLGFMNPFIPSWGVMLENAYGSGYALRAWWWTLSPGIAISFTVLCIYMLGRGYERVSEHDTFEGGP